MKRIKTYMPEEDSTQYSKEYKSKLLKNGKIIKNQMN